MNSFVDSIPAVKEKSARRIFADNFISFLLRLLVVLLLVSGTTYYVHYRISVLHLAYRIGKASEEYSRLEEENRRLNIELSSLKQHERIERIAQERLKMVVPDHSRIVKIEMRK